MKNCPNSFRGCAICICEGKNDSIDVLRIDFRDILAEPSAIASSYAAGISVTNLFVFFGKNKHSLNIDYPLIRYTSSGESRFLPFFPI